MQMAHFNGAYAMLMGSAAEAPETWEAASLEDIT